MNENVLLVEYFQRVTERTIDMAMLFKQLIGKVSQDRYGNFHKMSCPMRNSRFTVIVNHRGLKMNECYVKYCPCCGEKLNVKKW